MTLDQTSTIAAAKDYVNQNIGDGVACPVCQQEVKLQEVRLSYKLASLLVLLHKTFAVGTVVDINRFIKEAKSISPPLPTNKDVERLLYWGLLDGVVVDDDLKKRYREIYGGRGKFKLHRLSERGMAFVSGAAVVKSVYVYGGRAYTWSESTWTVHDILNGKVSLEQLWNLPVPSSGQVG